MRADFATPDVDVVDLAVITIDASVLKRIEEAFLNVVEIASSFVRRVCVHCHRQFTIKRAETQIAEDCADLGAVFSAFAADQRAVTNPAVIMIHARRPRQFYE